MSNEIIKNNSDFIFLYEAKQTNPNGDPDMENKPRMDYDTKTNLVSKYRRKRDIRDYVKYNDKDIFVDTIDDNKVSAETKLNFVIDKFLQNQDKANKILSENKIWTEMIKNIKNSDKKNYNDIYKEIKSIVNSKTNDDNVKKIKKSIKEHLYQFNNNLLTEIIKRELYDIRLFGGAFAIEGFSKTFTGPVQLSWGYSLHPVELMKSNSLVTIMNDDSSTFGKTQNVEYSLIAFSGTISKNLADKTGLTDNDVEFFRKSMIESINFNKTTSKSNQYPVLYLELEYKEDFNGFLYDMRNMIKCNARDKDEIIRCYKDSTLDFVDLISYIIENKGIIKNVHLWESTFLPKECKINLKDKLSNQNINIKNIFKEEKKLDK